MRNLKTHLGDGAAGFLCAAALFFFIPLFQEGGNLGLPAGGILPEFAAAAAVFCIYAFTPSYKRRHAEGARSFCAALAAFLFGAAAGEGTVSLLAAFSITQWHPAL